MQSNNKYKQYRRQEFRDVNNRKIDAKKETSRAIRRFLSQNLKKVINGDECDQLIYVKSAQYYH